MNTFDWNKAFPWIVAAIIGTVALFAFKGSSPNIAPPNPWGPPNVNPNVQPHNPNCPDCFPRSQSEYAALNKLMALEASFKSERSAIRREMLRTQLNVAQAARDIGRTQPMRIPDWLYYQTLPDSYGGGVIGNSEMKSLKWDAAPTDVPDYGETPAAGK